MNHWLFQGNPDIFDIDTYMADQENIRWEVRQKRFARDMQPGDQVFIWRASGKNKAIAGVIAQGIITGRPRDMEDDAPELWSISKDNNRILRVPIKLIDKCLKAKEVVRREWLVPDPILENLRVLKLRSETNYRLERKEAERLAALVRNTGRDWSREESIAGLWAYQQTVGKPVSLLPGSPVSEVALAIGRAVTGVYNKVMNFRALDPGDKRKGLTAGGHVDAAVWDEFYDVKNKAIRVDKLDKEYTRLWGKSINISRHVHAYKDFGDAPNDDPEELQQFAAKVRRGQPAFRKSLLNAYGKKCSLCGYGPVEVLAAVHIIEHAKTGINELDNGLLMRADLHSLFDAGLLHIDPSNLTIVIDETLRKSPYYELHGKLIRTRVDGSQIGEKYLKQRWMVMTGRRKKAR